MKKLKAYQNNLMHGKSRWFNILGFKFQACEPESFMVKAKTRELISLSVQ